MVTDGCDLGTRRLSTIVVMMMGMVRLNLHRYQEVENGCDGDDDYDGDGEVGSPQVPGG